MCQTQRLSGPGYCFSASAPPFVNAAARAALHEMRERPQLLVDLRDRSRELRKRLVKSCNGILKVVSWKDSPIIHLRIDKDASGGGRRLSRSSNKVSFTPTDGLEYDEYDIGFIIALKRACRMAGIAVSANRQGATTLVKYPFPPTLRLCVNVMLSDEELDECAHIVSTEAKRLLKDGGSFLHNSNFWIEFYNVFKENSHKIDRNFHKTRWLGRRCFLPYLMNGDDGPTYLHLPSKSTGWAEAALLRIVFCSPKWPFKRQNGLLSRAIGEMV